MGYKFASSRSSIVVLEPDEPAVEKRESVERWNKRKKKFRSSWRDGKESRDIGNRHREDIEES